MKTLQIFGNSKSFVVLQEANTTRDEILNFDIGCCHFTETNCKRHFTSAKTFYVLEKKAKTNWPSVAALRLPEASKGWRLTARDLEISHFVARS